MRIVLLPNIGLSNIHADSDYYGYKKMIDVATKFYDDMYFYFVVPEHFKDKVEEMPRTKIIGIPESRGFNTNEHVTSIDFWKMFNWASGRIITDGMFTSRHHVGMFWKHAAIHNKRRYKYPVVFRQPVLVEFAKERDLYDAVYAMSLVVCDSIIYGDESYANTQDLVRKYLSPDLCNLFDEKTLKLTVGLEIDYFDMLLKKNKKHEKFTLFYGTRFNSVKRVEKVFELYDRFYSSGRPIDIIMTTPNPDGTLEKKKFMTEFLQGCIKYLYTSCPRQKYFEEASKCHAFIVTSEGENASNFIVEQLYLGLIGVFPDRKYVWEMIPKNYPFIYRSMDEAYMWLAEIEKDYPAALRKIEPTREYIRTHYHKDMTFKAHVDFLRQSINREMDVNMSLGLQNEVVDVIRETALEFDEPFKFDTFIEILNKRMMIKVDYLHPDRLNGRETLPFDVRLVLEKIGFRDTCESDTMIFKKGEGLPYE
ncbi:MAG: hypothetical protein V1799_07810 [bacterium]